MSDLKMLDIYSLPSPCYVIDIQQLQHNVTLLEKVQEQSGAKILLALKAFSMFSVAPIIMQKLKGVCASGLHEARLGYEEFKGEVHTYSTAFIPQDVDEILKISNHVIFNSLNQWQTYKEQCLKAQQKNAKLSFGLRINPEHSESETPLYDPCAPCSRMGIPISQLAKHNLEHIDGIHFHTLCEQGVEPLQRTLQHIEKNIAGILHNVQWVNFGGGHHITAKGYNIDALIKTIKNFQAKYNVQVYLEPGEAVALNAGVLVSQVLDIIDNTMPNAILDTSATCHMPDVLEMPYRPRCTQESNNNSSTTYRLGGPSCLAGDIIGDYAFNPPLNIGDRLTFEDMAIYTMVKNTTFNGINLPTIATWDNQTRTVNIIKRFNYADFKQRLS